MTNISKILLFVFIVVISKVLHQKINMSDDDTHQEIRLPKNIVPEHYDLWVKPDFAKFTFEGKVEIAYNKTDQKPTSKVILHVNDIKITNGHLNGSKLVKTVYNDKTETATLQFDTDIPDNGKIVLDYVGNLNEQLIGFYRTSVTIDNTKIYAATTKFEPTEARRFLPCWDEPAIKATFAITLVYKRWLSLPGDKKIEYVALSNTPILSQEGDEELTVKFKTSPKMSTYLLALIVGPFEYIEKSDGKRPVRVYTPPGKKEFGQFALEVACKSLQFYENYFEIEYPLEKMDLIAIPDFTSGAMENWGLVTFRETALLVDPENSSTGVKQRVGIVVIHELAHQWFGNLVTMEWWTHLWLNEGFACFMEHLCGDHIFPEYDMWSQFVSDAYSLALNLDSMHNSHPIEVPVNHPSEVKEIFDVISYKKGASIIRMIYDYIGDDAFRRGMKEYLSKYAYKNTVTEDLWACLEKASNKPVTKLGSDWTSQMGYPWISVVSSTIEGDKVKLELNQEKFSSDGINLEEEKNMTWRVPIATINGGNPLKRSPTILVEGKTSQIIVENAGDNWIKLNPNSVALYRTAYSQDMSAKFLPAITNKSLPAVDRLSLQSDFFALTLAGKLDTVSYLKFLESFNGEDDYNVWSSIDSSIGRLSIILAGSDYNEMFKAYGRSLYKNIYQKVGWEVKPSEKHTDSLMRSLILNRMASLECENFIAEARIRFESHISKKKLIPADLRLAIYKAMSRFGNAKEFDSIFDIFRSTDLHEEKNRAAASLGFTRDPERLARVIDFGFSDEIRDQDRIYVFAQLGSTNPDQAWKVFQEKKGIIEQKYQASHLFRGFVKYSTENFASEEKAQEVEKFFNENNFPAAKRTIKQSLETIKLNANLLTRDGKAIRTFLSTLKLLK